MKDKRESGIELFRCVLMLFVILVHYNNSNMGGAFNYVTKHSANYYLIFLLESMAIIGVNGFVLITGYFGHKSKEQIWKKPLGLLITVIVYNILFYFGSMVVGEESFNISRMIECLLPRNWYVLIYIALILIAPYINIVIDKLDKKQMLNMVFVLLLIFSVWPTLLDCAGGFLMRYDISVSGLYTIANSGSANGYSIVNFSLLYILGATIRKCDLFNWNKCYDLAGYIFTAIAIFVVSLYTEAIWNYSSFPVILSALFLFNFFRKLKFKSRLVNFVSKSTFGIYLISTQGFIVFWFWDYFNIEQYCKGNLVGLIINITVCVVATFIVCAVADCVYRLASKCIVKGVKNSTSLLHKI